MGWRLLGNTYLSSHSVLQGSVTTAGRAAPWQRWSDTTARSDSRLQKILRLRSPVKKWRTFKMCEATHTCSGDKHKHSFSLIYLFSSFCQLRYFVAFSRTSCGGRKYDPLLEPRVAAGRHERVFSPMCPACRLPGKPERRCWGHTTRPAVWTRWVSLWNSRKWRERKFSDKVFESHITGF